MTRKTLFLDEQLYHYLVTTSVRSLPIQQSLAEATTTMQWSGIESSPEQVQLLQCLIGSIEAKRCLEVGVFTGYSTLAMALALPADGSIVACDIDETATMLAREYWQRAGVAAKIDLRLAPALVTLESLLTEGQASTFDLAYIDADKANADGYYERVLRLLRPNGLMLIDNAFWNGRVADASIDDYQTRSVRKLNDKVCRDSRVDANMIPLGDGMLFVRKRPEIDESRGVANTQGWSRHPVSIDIVDCNMCAAVCGEIYEQRPRWAAHRLNNLPPFYTLGAASYLALGFEAGSLRDYFAEAATPWQWAGHAVLTVMERVRAALMQFLQQPVEYPALLPPPGFHIFIGAGIPRTDCEKTREDCGSCHFDLQHSLIPWERWYREVDVDNTISFTLPLKLPAEGGGLVVWESLTSEGVRDDIANNRVADISSVAHCTPNTIYPYSIGRLILHSGHILHQMAGVNRFSVRDERITLQGHGVFADGAWRLYW